MIVSNSCAKDINIAYIGGGSKGWAWGLMSDLAVEEKLSGTVKLYDINRKAAEDNAIIGNKLFSRAEYKNRWCFEVSETLKEALTGANFVIASILPGTFDEMESDVDEPKKYGILQPVGDTVGPGGLVRALRTIPQYRVIAEAIRDIAPDAWVINYTNPMTVCTQTLYAVFPKIRAIGCCHEVFGTQQLLASAAAEADLGENIKRADIKVNVAGINHFTWLTSACYNSIDLFPVYRKFVDKYYESGYQKPGENWMNNFFWSAQRVKFDLFKRYGIIAAAGDRHLAEFCPGSWYLKDDKTLEKYMFQLTPVQWRKGEYSRMKNEESRQLLSGEKEFEIKETGEEGVKIMLGLLGLGDLVTNANMPNIGQVEGIPMGSVVETNVLVRENSITPLYAGALPDEVLNLVLPHVYNQRGIVEAGLTCNRQKAFNCFLNDPLMNISLTDAEVLFDRMLKNTAKYLPGWEL